MVRYLYMALLVVVLGLAACGGEQPLTVNQIEQTRVAAATAAVEAQTNAEATRQAQIGGRAPAGAVVAAVPPDRAHNANLQIPFEAMPPNGGTHNPVWQVCDVYDAPVRPEHAVHSMEHGAVWLTYRPDLDQDSVQQLARRARGQSFLLVSPYPNQRSPIVLTAWGVQLELEAADDERIDQFLDAYLVGPQTPELGASCVGGTRETVAQ